MKGQKIKFYYTNGTTFTASNVQYDIDCIIFPSAKSLGCINYQAPLKDNRLCGYQDVSVDINELAAVEYTYNNVTFVVKFKDKVNVSTNISGYGH